MGISATTVKHAKCAQNMFAFAAAGARNVQRYARIVMSTAANAPTVSFVWTAVLVKSVPVRNTSVKAARSAAIALILFAPADTAALIVR